MKIDYYTLTIVYVHVYAFHANVMSQTGKIYLIIQSILNNWSIFVVCKRIDFVYFSCNDAITRVGLVSSHATKFTKLATIP